MRNYWKFPNNNGTIVNNNGDLLYQKNTWRFYNYKSYRIQIWPAVKIYAALGEMKDDTIKATIKDSSEVIQAVVLATHPSIGGEPMGQIREKNRKYFEDKYG